MIEQAIYFALGCIVTALLALLFAPVFWARAKRLTRQRLQLQVPLSMQEILAERDQLRAEFAVERLRIEQAMERVQAARDHDMAELGRRSMEVIALTEAAAESRRADESRLEEIAGLQRDAHELRAENGSLHMAAHDSHAGLDLWRGRAERAREHQERLQDEVDMHRTTIASLKTRGMGLEMQLTDAERAQEQRRMRLETAMGHVARHESASLLLRRELDDAKAQLRRYEDDAAAGRGAASGEGPPADDAGLRETIHALGLAVAKLSRTGLDTPPRSRGRRAVTDDAPRPLGVA